MNQSITMTPEQTALYDADGREAVELMTDLGKQAQAMADDTGSVVEIVTEDGIVAGSREPQAGPPQNRGPCGTRDRVPSGQSST